MNPVEKGGRSGHGRLWNAALFLAVVSGLGTLGFVLAPAAPAPKERSITVRAHRYGYDPKIIRVNRGDRVRLRFVSEDVTHGFYLEGYDLDVSIPPMHPSVEWRKPSQPGKLKVIDEVAFTADREGKFRYRCSMTCGFLHPFMLGEFIVSPNRLLPVSLGLTWGVLVGGFLVVVLKGTHK
ncbi:MAG: hypothetical protein HY644_10340 [Acidobacteria bacterium]|nr:hypothetical protein [Acidobacteriota bacterium]